jgi:Protein of unknown function (DUF669)
MTIDLNDTEGRTLIPPGVYALKIQVNYGNAGSDGVLRRAKNGHSLMLELECTVLDSKHAGRKIWEYLTVELDDNGSPLAADKLDKLKTPFASAATNCAISSIVRTISTPTIPAKLHKRNVGSKATANWTSWCFGRRSKSVPATMATARGITSIS